MEIPTIQTTLTFRKGEEEKKILSDIIKKSDDKFSSIHFENAILFENPFESDFQCEIYQTSENTYTIERYENAKIIDYIHVSVGHVLSFQGKYFELKEIALDKVE